MKELTESPPVSAFRARFEAGRSFDLDDDLEFCPGLLTEDDVSLANLFPGWTPQRGRSAVESSHDGHGADIESDR